MKKFFATASLLACVTVLGTAPAMARVNVDLHVGVGVPGVVYVHPAPVYVQPQPVYVQPYPVYVYPAPVYTHPPHSHWQKSRRITQGESVSPSYYPYGDRDRDGVPNRWDYRPYDPYRH